MRKIGREELDFRSLGRAFHNSDNLTEREFEPDIHLDIGMTKLPACCPRVVRDPSGTEENMLLKHSA